MTHHLWVTMEVYNVNLPWRNDWFFRVLILFLREYFDRYLEDQLREVFKSVATRWRPQPVKSRLWGTQPVSGLKTYLISRSIFFPGPRSDFEIPIRIVDFLKKYSLYLPTSNIRPFWVNLHFVQKYFLTEETENFTRKWRRTQNRINIAGGKVQAVFYRLTQCFHAYW